MSKEEVDLKEDEALIPVAHFHKVSYIDTKILGMALLPHTDYSYEYLSFS